MHGIPDNQKLESAQDVNPPIGTNQSTRRTKPFNFSRKKELTVKNQCKLCDKNYNSIESLLRHIKSHGITIDDYIKQFSIILDKCNCGCGQEVNIGRFFKKGHYGIGKSPSQKTRDLWSKTRKGRKLSEEHKRKIGLTSIGRKNNLGRVRSEEEKKKQSETLKKRKGGIVEKDIALYSTYAHQLIPVEKVIRIRNLSGIKGKADMKVVCYKCGELFFPKRKQAYDRARAIRDGFDNYHFYCCDECKYNCPIFGQYKFPKGFLPTRLRPEVDPLIRDMTFERDGYRCVKCGSTENLECHHIDPATQNPMLANDICSCMTVCYICHDDIHRQEGCKPHQLTADFGCNL